MCHKTVCNCVSLAQVCGYLLPTVNPSYAVSAAAECTDLATGIIGSATGASGIFSDYYYYLFLFLFF